MQTIKNLDVRAQIVHAVVDRNFTSTKFAQEGWDRQVRNLGRPAKGDLVALIEADGESTKASC